MEGEGSQRTSPVSMVWLNKARQTLSEGGTRSGRDVIDGLISHLSDWDIMYLRQRIAKLRVGADSFATFTDLPQDCIYLMLPYLGIRDLYVMMLVSREWYRVLTDPDFLIALGRFYFEGFLPPGSNQVDAIRRKFNQLVRLHSRKAPDTCGTMFVPWDIEGHSGIITMPSTIRPSLSSLIGPIGRILRNPTFVCYYADGKVVQHLHRNFLLVDDVKTGNRAKVPMIEDPRTARTQLRVETVTGRILVVSSFPGPKLPGLAGSPSTLSATSAQAARLRTLQVYNLDRLAWRDITLPAPLNECFAYDDKFALTFNTQTAMLWTLNKGLVDLPVNHPRFHAVPEGSKNLFDGHHVTGAFFHPFDPHTIFLTWVYVFEGVEVSDYLYHVVVVKYTYQGGSVPWIPTKDYRYYIKHPIPKPKPRNHCFGGHAPPLTVVFSRRCSKTNSQGTFLIGLFFLANYRNEHNNDGICGCVRSEWDKDSVSTINFNVVTESFSVERFSGFKTKWAVNTRTVLCKNRGFDDQGTFDHVQVWNGELFNLYTKMLSSGTAPVVQSIRADGSHGSGHDGEIILDHMSNQRATIEGPYQLFVDDDFVIAAGHHGYTVWRWDKRQPSDGGHWLPTDAAIYPNMREFNPGSEVDLMMEPQPPYIQARSETYDKLTYLSHHDRDIYFNPEFEG